MMLAAGDGTEGGSTIFDGLSKEAGLVGFEVLASLAGFEVFGPLEDAPIAKDEVEDGDIEDDESAALRLRV